MGLFDRFRKKTTPITSVVDSPQETETQTTTAPITITSTPSHQDVIASPRPSATDYPFGEGKGGESGLFPRGGGGGGGSSAPPAPPTSSAAVETQEVTTTPTTVVIDGQGFSARVEDQAALIRQFGRGKIAEQAAFRAEERARSSGDAAKKRKLSLQETEELANQAKNRDKVVFTRGGETFTRGDLLDLGIAGGIRKRRGESDSKFAGRAVSYGKTVAEGTGYTESREYLESRGQGTTGTGFSIKTYANDYAALQQSIKSDSPSKIAQGYNALNTYLSQKFVGANILAGQLRSGLQKDTPPAFKGTIIEKAGNIILPSTVGVTAGILEDIGDKPLKNVALYGAGFGTSYGLKSIGKGISYVGGLFTATKFGTLVSSKATKFGALIDTSLLSYKAGLKASPAGLLSSGIKVPKGSITVLGVGEKAVGAGGLVLGGIYASSVYTEYKSTPSIQGKSGVLGVAVKDLTLFGFGFRGGQTAFAKTTDIIKGIGVKKIELPAVGTKSFEKYGIENFYRRNVLGQFQKRQYEVVDPQYFQGVKYPKVFKGQTAGQLKSEFFKPILPKEIKGVARGLHAAPKDFAKETSFSAGSSEVAGGFFAPKLSATFLKIGGEKPLKLFSTEGLLTPSEPTAIRLQFNKIEFAPKVSASTKIGSVPLTQSLKTFFKDIGGSGKAVIEGTKTEKQLIFAHDSPIYEIGGRKTRFQFELEGRKPITKQFKIVESQAELTQLKKSGVKIEKLGDVMKSSSSSYTGTSTSLIKPAPLFSSSSSVSSSKSFFSPLKSSSKSSLSSSRLSSFSSFSSSGRSSSRSSSSFSPRSLSSSSSSSSSSSLRLSSGGGSSSGIRYGSPYKSSSKGFAPRKIIKGKKPQQLGAYTVSLRRFGKFKPVGTGLTLSRAFELGRRKASTTLGATFKLTTSKGKGQGLNLRTPAGFYRKSTKKEGTLFIEKRQFRLSKKSEKKEINFYRGIRR